MPKSSSKSKNNIGSKLKSISPIQMFYLNSILLGLAIILLGVSIWIQHRPNTSLVKPSGGYSKGTTITQGSVTIRADGFSYTQGKGHARLPDNKQYLIVTMTIKNNSKLPINIFPSSDIYAKNQAGQVVFLTPYRLERPFRAGQLLPAEQISGQLSYLIAKNQTYKLYADAIWSGGVIDFAIR